MKPLLKWLAGCLVGMVAGAALDAMRPTLEPPELKPGQVWVGPDFLEREIVGVDSRQVWWRRPFHLAQHVSPWHQWRKWQRGARVR